jgi:hypothetical protein
MPRLVVRYEDLLADPSTTLAGVAKFCGFEATPAAIAAAVENSDFSRLSDREAESGFLERPAGMARFFRTGRAGNWRTELSPDQIRTIEDDHGAIMRRFGYLPGG